jgi:hypothetical protein
MSEPKIIPGLGGAIAIDADGRVEITPPTQDHPEGNAPRDAEGKRLDVVSPPEPKE